MDLKGARLACSSLSFACGIALCALAADGCSSKTLQYPADHERIQRIDRAVESLRDAYQSKDPSAFRAVLLPLDELESLQHQVEADFDAFHAISLEFKVERVMIEGDNIDVYVHWQGVWKKHADDTGVRQRGHARLQWAGTTSILLRGVQGDLPFGMKTKQALSEVPLSKPAPR
ncbi:MAG: hypothetical protein OEV17_00265 [Nitrospira sp.]|nr:hypothetical protein [Nitrospira sp.]